MDVEHLELSGTTFMMRGPIVCQLSQQGNNNILKMDFMLLAAIP